MKAERSDEKLRDEDEPIINEEPSKRKENQEVKQVSDKQKILSLEESEHRQALGAPTDVY